MPDLKLDISTNLLVELAKPSVLLEGMLNWHRGARIGQSTVASRKMHTIEPPTPESVTVLTNVDAGQAFYNRQKEGEIVHLDIFHQCGQVDHRQVAVKLRQAIEIYDFHRSIFASHNFAFRAGKDVSADYVDVQTGTGGGRITGSLNYGQKLSLRRAHENHVHITAMIPGAHLACLFYLVLAAEEAIGALGLELRRNERIVHGRGGGSGGDLSPYCDQTDSFLRRKGAGATDLAKRHQYLQDVTDLADEFDTVQDVRETLGTADMGAREETMLQTLAHRGSGDQALRRLERQGIVSIEGGKVRLTEYGQEFKGYLDRHLPDIEAYLRRAFRLFRPPVWRPGHSKLLAEGQGGNGPKKLKPWESNGPGGELAVAETVNAAARRTVETVRDRLEITAGDLREFVRKRRQKAEICLLIDSSASMTGQRLRAAKFLARHLLLSTPDRLAIVTFQEDAAKLILPLTRDWQQAESSLREIKSFGSTPLANGLTTCLDYLRGACVRNPLILLITDGIPTVAEYSRDPLADALTAAAAVKQSGYGFACIGLKPHRHYLRQLCEQAGGSLYVLEELEKQAMVKAAWSERESR